jgi:hypothetical protein
MAMFSDYTINLDSDHDKLSESGMSAAMQGICRSESYDGRVDGCTTDNAMASVWGMFCD